MLSRRVGLSARPAAASARLRSLSVAAAAKGFGANPKAPPAKSKVLQTCTCGSKAVYRECCEPFHNRKASPGSAEEALRSRFSAICKGEVDYLLSTDHRPKTLEDPEQMKRDMTYTVKNFKYSGLKILEQEPGSSDAEQKIKFQYKSRKEFKEKTRFKVKEKGEEPEKNIDGSYRIYTTVERSLFKKEDDSQWVLADSEVLSHE